MSDSKNWPSWRCEAGAVNVWKIVEGQQKLENGTVQPVKISIQQVPEGRREETLDFMDKYFIEDEPICKCLNAKDDPEYIKDFRMMWNYCLDQGMVEAAYVIDSSGNISELVAVNMLYAVSSKETDKEMESIVKNMTSKKWIRSFRAIIEFANKADACEILGVDKYISAFGLAVATHWRGQKLGLRMLEARVDIGKKYSIPASSTIFSAPASQIIAKRSGHEEKLSQDYEEFVDVNNRKIFPNSEAKDMKIMMRMLY